jgi:hypothetical protein
MVATLMLQPSDHLISRLIVTDRFRKLICAIRFGLLDEGRAERGERGREPET